MNDDLNKLYGNNQDTVNNNSNNVSNNTNNIGISGSNDLNSMYNIGSTQSNNYDIHQSGTDLLYNQNNNPQQPEEKNIPEENQLNNLNDNNTNEMLEHISDDDLLAAYVGNNYPKIGGKPINFAAMFFNFLYLLYRKQYLYALLYYAIYLGLLYLGINYIIVSICLGLLLGVGFNTFYINKAKRKVEIIKSQNKDRPLYEIKKICERKGGTSIIALILGIVVQIISVALLSVTILASFTFFYSLVNSNEEEIEIDDSFDGIIKYDTKANIPNTFSVYIPEDYKPTSFNDNSQYDYEIIDKSNTYNTCTFTLGRVKDETNPEKYLKKLAYYYEQSAFYKVETKQINNLEWQLYTSNDKSETTYYYVTEINNKVYMLNIVIPKEDNIKCKENSSLIVESIQEK